METEEKQIEISSDFHTRGEITAKSYDPETRTLEVVFATENPVLRNTWESGRFNEILSCKKSDVRTERISIGPVLDNHSRWQGVRSVIGTVQKVKIVGKQCTAIIKMSQREDVKPIIQDIEDGILRSISVGYVVHQYKEIKDGTTKEGETPTYRAIDWEPKEISFVPMPADIGAGVRSSEPKKEGSYQVRLITEKSKVMDKEPIETDPNKVRKIEEPTPAPVKVVEQVRTEPTEPTEEQRNAIATEERARVEAIRSAAKVVNVDDEEFIRGAIDTNMTLAGFREKLFERMAQDDATKNNGPANVTVIADEQTKLRAVMSDALDLKANPSVQLDDDATRNSERISAAREFRGMSLVDMAKDNLERAGVSGVRSMSKLQIVQAACGASEATRGLHTTSDFPTLLGSTFRRTLTRAYTARAQSFRQWATRGTMPDFRATTRASISGMIGDLDKIPEGGEYKSGTFKEGKETYALSKYGKIVNFSWEAMVNDDLGFMGRIPRAMAARVAQLQSNIVYGILSANPVMGDGTALFHASHGNLLTGAAISQSSLNEARKLIRLAKDPNNDILDLVPKFLLVGPDNEMLARQFTSSEFTPTEQVKTNPWKGAFIPIEEPRLGADWYVIADPGMVDTVEYSFLDGESEIHMEQRDGFNVDGIDMKIRTVFAAKALDHRGIVRNPGA